MKISIHNEKKVKDFLKKNWSPEFRYNQIENAIYKNLTNDFNLIENIPKELREKLKKNFFYYSLNTNKIETSSNWQTTKILFKTISWEFIESVIMRHLTGRISLCISCQAGCSMACSFCVPPEN